MFGDIEIEGGNNNKFTLGLERLLLQYSPSDSFNLSAGQYFTDIGFYNAAHRGAWLQTAADLPFIFQSEDEGGILPIHKIGLSANGRIPSGTLGLRYVAEVGVSHTWRSPVDSEGKSIGENNSLAVNLALLARPEKIPGLQAGFSIYRDRLAPDGLPKMGQTIMAAHIVYQRSSLEILNEALVVRHTPRGTNRVFNTTGFYTQVSRQFGKYRPFFRYDYLNAADSEPLFDDVRRRNGPSIGLRYDLSDFVALKAQYQHTSRRAMSPLNLFMLQMSFAF
jgi:hypothetical protein